MTAVLPRGLINANPDGQRHALAESNVNITNSEIVRKFWRLYAIQSGASEDTVAERSRNLFWRVWSSPTLTESISSARLTSLWQRCSQEFDLTPIDGVPAILPSILQNVSTPRQSRTRSASLSPSAEVRPTADSSPRHGQDVSSTVQDFRWIGIGQPQRGESSRLALRSAAEASGQRSDSTSGSTSQTNSEASSKPGLSRTVSGGRQRLPVVATAGKARTRPSVTRRKSSLQKSGSSVSQPKSPRAADNDTEIPNFPEERARAARLAVRGPPPGLPVLAALSGPALVLPSASSWQSVESTSPNRSLATTAPTQTTTSGALVDPDFRNKFVETQKKLTSSTNLAGLDRIRRPGSIVRFADELPREDIGKGKEREVPTSPLRNENAIPSRLHMSMASIAISDDSDTESSSSGQMELPRTKSHLSLLINNKRNQTGDTDIGPAPQSQGPAGKDKEKARSKEEELLSMGRRDGVTKAGGVQVPKQQRVSELEDPGYHSPSSPEPLF